MRPPYFFAPKQTFVTITYSYELLVGETPFGRGSPKATMALIAETTKDPYFPSHLSTYAIDIIKRLLTRDQAARLVLQHPLPRPTFAHAVCRAMATTALPPSRYTRFSG